MLIELKDEIFIFISAVKGAGDVFQQLSHYNYDYALASIPIQLILLIFYCSRRNLPVRSSFSFLLVMIANLVMTAFDLISCEMNEIWTEYPLWLMYIVNQAYFLGFIGRGWALYDYTAEECQGYSALGKNISKLANVPAIVAALLILSTPWTATIFHFAPEKGYYNCYIYPIIYFCTYFYIFMSLLCVFLRWKQTDIRLKTSMVGYNLVLIAGIVLRKQFIDTFVTSYFSILAILFIYLSAQNPDLYRDKETRLLNRAAFEKIGAEFLEKRIPFRYIIFKIDNYSSAKSLYGYQQLGRTADLIGQWLRDTFPDDYAFYHRNGEFLILQQGVFEDSGETIVQKLKTAFERPWKSESSEVSLSISAMVMPYQIMPKNIKRIEDLVIYAYGKMHEENKKGNTMFSGDIVTALDRQIEVEIALSKGLANHSLEAYLQPIYCVKEKRIVGAEALARLRDPKLGFIPPDEFVRAAERNGDIAELGRQIFEKVCGFIATGQPERLGMRTINVNLSPAQCRSDQLAPELISIAEKQRVPLSFIDFEITESSAEDHQLLLKQMSRLEENGAQFALDDFGTGTSNLIRLLKLPISFVKLDKFLVDSYFKGESGILPDLVRMFHNAGKMVVAEGVETETMKEELIRMGCDYEQGYYFSKPIPPEEFVAYMEKANSNMDSY